MRNQKRESNSFGLALMTAVSLLAGDCWAANPTPNPATTVRIIDDSAPNPGVDGYICNAGIKYRLPISELCFIPNTSTACDPSLSDNCVCTNSTDTNHHKLNFLAAGYSSYTSGSYNTTTTTVSSGVNTFTQLFADNTFGNRIDSLTIHLGSDRYTAEYFIDVCYHGHDREWYRNGNSRQTRVSGTVTSTNFNPGGSGLSYISLAGPMILSSTTQIRCDQQGVGTYKWGDARTRSGNGSPGAGDYTSLVMDTWDKITTLGSSVSITSSGGAVSVFNNVSMAAGYGVRFCLIRYVIQETNTGNLRKWQRADANFQISTSVYQL